MLDLVTCNVSMSLFCRHEYAMQLTQFSGSYARLESTSHMVQLISFFLWVREEMHGGVFSWVANGEACEWGREEPFWMGKRGKGM